MRIANLLCAASWGCLAAVSAARADTTSTKIETVVVTAEKREVSVQKLPSNITVLDQQTLKDMGAQAFQDYATTVPSLSFESLAPGEQRILLRGVSDGVNQELRGRTQNVTGVYIDDMVVSNNYTSPDLNLFDVNRVEVLKGPQGTLYGDGSVGGLVRIITNKPNLDGFAASVEGTVATVDHGGGDYSLNGMVNLPLVDNELALRVVGQYRRTDGFIDDVVRNASNVNSFDETGIRASLLWAPTSNFNVTFNGVSQHSKLGGQNDFDPQYGDLKRGTFFSEPIDTKFDLGNVTANWDMGWSSLLSSTSYAKFERHDRGDDTDLIASILNAAFGLPVVLPGYAAHSQRSDTFSEELRLVSPSGQALRWVGGLYYSSFREKSSETDLNVGLFDLFAGLGLPLQNSPWDVGQDVIFADTAKQTTHNYAAFGELTYDLTSSLSGTVGVRYFRDELQHETSAGGVANFPLASYSLNKSSTEDGVVYRFRLADQIDDNKLVYALASEGYRTGGINPLNPVTINDPTFPAAFSSDHLWNYEAGWKSVWLNQTLVFNGAAYYIDWQNVQIQTPLPSGFSIIANAGSAKIKGAEVELDYYPTDYLSVGFSGSLTDAELGADTPTLGSNAHKGAQLTGVPKSQLSLFAQLTEPLGNDVQGVLRADLQHVSSIHGSFDPSLDRVYGNYTLVNARASVEWSSFAITLFAKNLTDERAAFFKDVQGSLPTPVRNDIFVGQPRTIGITFSKSF